MAAALLHRAWASATDAELRAMRQAAARSVAGFAAATATAGSLLRSWTGAAPLRSFDHQPPGDVVDARSGSQFYYHAHRRGAAEHGHVHLFWHASASGGRRYLRAGRPAWVRSAPTHLLAIGLDARGLPRSLFTVNQWVTDGHCFDAAATLACVDRFAPAGVPGHEASCAWLSGLVRMYRPLIADLLRRRDARLATRADPVAARQDRRLELLSRSSIDWAADLDQLEQLAAGRQLCSSRAETAWPC